MRVGITATRRGLTDYQKMTVSSTLESLLFEYTNQLHHGMCIGGDLQVHKICRGLFGKNVEIHGHPSNLDRFRAQCDCDVYYTPKAPLVRNRDIVIAVQTMIALPGEDEEILRSGTWATIRYARMVKRQMITIYPYPSPEPSDDLAA